MAYRLIKLYVHCVYIMHTCFSRKREKDVMINPKPASDEMIAKAAKKCSKI